MSDWQSIETAPRDGSPVYLRSPSFAPPEPFWWNAKMGVWQTKVFAIARSVTGWWDEDLEQPTEWRDTPSPA